MNTVPKIALGAWSWGAGAAGGDQVFGSHLFEDDLRPVFDKAMECGLTLWDTAAVYGEGTSERILGSFVKDVSREQVIISTKFTPQIASDSPWAIAKGTLPIIGVTKVEQVEAAAKAAEIALTADEISELEALGDTANINTLREWEKEM